MAVYNVKKGKIKIKLFTYHKHEIKNVKDIFTIHMLHVLKSFYKTNDPFSKKFLKIKICFQSFLKIKPVKDVDLRKSNGSEFHSLGAHIEKVWSS